MCQSGLIGGLNGVFELRQVDEYNCTTDMSSSLHSHRVMWHAMAPDVLQWEIRVSTSCEGQLECISKHSALPYIVWLYVLAIHPGRALKAPYTNPSFQ